MKKRTLSCALALFLLGSMALSPAASVRAEELSAIGGIDISAPPVSPAEGEGAFIVKVGGETINVDDPPAGITVEPAADAGAPDVTVTVEAPIQAEGTGEAGIQIFADNGGSVSIAAEDVSSEHSVGVSVMAIGADSTAEASAGAVDAGSSTGVSAGAYTGGSVTIETESVSAGNVGVSAAANDAGSSVEVTAGAVDGGNGGVEANAYTGGSVTVTAEDVSSAFSSGVEVLASGDGSSAEVNTGAVEAVGVGVVAEAIGEADASVQAGDVTVTGNGDSSLGVLASAGNGGEASVQAGDVTVTGSEAGTSAAVAADASHGGTADITVNSNVSAAGGEATGIQAESAGGTAEVTVGEDVTADGNGIKAEASGGGTVFVEVGGNVQAEQVGLLAGADHAEGTKIDVVIGGTLTAGQQTVVVDERVTEENLSLTVWKIETPAGKAPETVVTTKPGAETPAETGEALTPAEEGTASAPASSSGSGAAFTDASIRYIIKVEQPEAGGTLAAVGTTGSVTVGGETYGTAHENETVTLKIGVQKGYRLTGAFNGQGDGKIEITAKDADGNYYIKVPKGGGVYLSVELEEEPKPDPQPDPEPKPAPAPRPYPSFTDIDINSLVSISVAPAAPAAAPAAITLPGQTARTVKGTVNHATHLEKFDDVVKPLTGETLTRLQNGNAVFAAAFDKENAKRLDRGVVNFNGAFDDAEEDVILIPSESWRYLKNNTYTVVLSDGTVLQVKCTAFGVLEIPVPKTAAGLGFVVLQGTLESNQPVKWAKLRQDSLKTAGANTDDAIKGATDDYLNEPNNLLNEAGLPGLGDNNDNTNTPP